MNNMNFINSIPKPESMHNPTFSNTGDGNVDRGNADIREIRDNNLNGNRAEREDNPVQRCRFSVPECISNAMKAIGNFFRSIFNLFRSNSATPNNTETPNNTQTEQSGSYVRPAMKIGDQKQVYGDWLEYIPRNNEITRILSELKINVSCQDFIASRHSTVFTTTDEKKFQKVVEITQTNHYTKYTTIYLKRIA